MAEWIFQRLDRTVERDSFDCGKAELNDYLKKYARQNDEKGIAVTIVAIPKSDGLKVVGYYSVSMAQIEFETMPDSLKKGLPRYPMPVMRIGKLAVDKSIQGQGLGAELLIDALRRALRLAQEVGIFAILVDALDEAAKAFYLRYGFEPLHDRPLSLVLSLRTLSKAFE
ncbi:MAG: GNAT family N-acetyltransferase [Cyanothece sp. SIO1E1]|nr:GNAT family N-acetyltransferase [Cyanothece sp. SIO1E1]